MSHKSSLQELLMHSSEGNFLVVWKIRDIIHHIQQLYLHFCQQNCSHYVKSYKDLNPNPNVSTGKKVN